MLKIEIQQWFGKSIIKQHEAQHVCIILSTHGEPAIIIRRTDLVRSLGANIRRHWQPHVSHLDGEKDGFKKERVDLSMKQKRSQLPNLACRIHLDEHRPS